MTKLVFGMYQCLDGHVDQMASAQARGRHFTCGKTAASVPYCWGYNGIGQLGDGTLTDRNAQVKMADPM